MNRILCSCSASAFVLLAATAAAAEVFPVVHNEPIAVRVLDGKDGKPQPRAHVILVAGYDRRDLALGLWTEEAITDASGLVRLSATLRNLPLLRVEVLKRRSCQADAADAAFSVERVRRDGLSTVDRCGTIAAEDTPGVFTVYVRGGKASTKAGPNQPGAAPPTKATQP